VIARINNDKKLFLSIYFFDIFNFFYYYYNYRKFCKKVYVLAISVACFGYILPEGYTPATCISSMDHLRGHHVPLKDLKSGPGKLIQGLGITRELYGTSLMHKNDLYIADQEAINDRCTKARACIGISKAQEKFCYSL
jgi:3-methyladenine DNA glycosylase Mpg